MIKNPDLTIVIATLGFDSIDETIGSILRYKKNAKIEIIVIGKVKEDILRKYKKLNFFRYIFASFPKGDLSQKKNLGFREANSEIVAFIDDDTVISPGWIEKGISHFKDKKVGVVSGPGVVPEKGDFLIKLFGNTLASLGGGPIRNRYKRSEKIEEDTTGEKSIGCNMTVRKDIYKKTKGFRTNVLCSEDFDLTARAISAGYKAYYDPEFYLYHYARSDFRKFFRQMSRYGNSKVHMIKKGSEPFKIVYLFPLISILMLPLLLVFSLFNEAAKTLFIILIGGYFLFLLIASVEAILRTGKIYALLLIFTIPFMHFAYGFGELKGFGKILIGTKGDI